MPDYVCVQSFLVLPVTPDYCVNFRQRGEIIADQWAIRKWCMDAQVSSQLCYSVDNADWNFYPYAMKLNVHAYHLYMHVTIWYISFINNSNASMHIFCIAVSSVTKDPITYDYLHEITNILTNWPLGQLNWIIEKSDSSELQWVFEVSLVKLLSSEFHWISLMISQHWFT